MTRSSARVKFNFHHKTANSKNGPLMRTSEDPELPSTLHAGVVLPLR